MLKALATASLAVMLAVNICGASAARAEETTVKLIGLIIDDEDGDGIGDTEVYEDNKGNIWLQFYDEDGNEAGLVKLDSTPNPAGDSSATVTPQSVKEALEAAMRKGGGTVYLTPEFLETPLGKALVETGKTGSIVPYHNPAEGLARDFEGGYGGGKGGIDPTGGSIAEQIKKHGSKNKKKNDDDDDNSPSSPGTADDDLQFGGASADMELVNPVPLPVLPVEKPAARSAKAKVKTKATGANKIDALMGKLPGPPQGSGQTGLPQSSAVPRRQPAAAMQLPSAVGGVGARTSAPSPTGRR